MCELKFSRFIICSCGASEEMPVDEQRHHSQHFEWIENYEDEGIYKCYDCKKLVISRVEDNLVDLIS